MGPSSNTEERILKALAATLEREESNYIRSTKAGRNAAKDLFKHMDTQNPDPRIRELSQLVKTLSERVDLLERRLEAWGLAPK